MLLLGRAVGAREARDRFGLVNVVVADDEVRAVPCSAALIARRSRTSRYRSPRPSAQHRPTLFKLPSSRSRTHGDRAALALSARRRACPSTRSRSGSTRVKIFAKAWRRSLSAARRGGRIQSPSRPSCDALCLLACRLLLGDTCTLTPPLCLDAAVPSRLFNALCVSVPPSRRRLSAPSDRAICMEHRCPPRSDMSWSLSVTVRLCSISADLTIRRR